MMLIPVAPAEQYVAIAPMTCSSGFVRRGGSAAAGLGAPFGRGVARIARRAAGGSVTARHSGEVFAVYEQ